jgi:hypothetical protein
VNLLGLRTEFRILSDDTAAPFLWDDAYVTLIANDAVKEAAERALLIEEDDNDNVCAIPAVAGTATYDLHPSIIKVRSVTWEGKFLTGTAREVLNERHPEGWTALTGTPCEFIDPQEKVLTLFRRPVLDGAVRLSVYRRPLEPLAEDGDVPELHERHHRGLLDWMLSLAYSRRDSDAYDPKLAATHDAAFTARFGVRLDANVLRQQRARRSNTVSMNPSW